MLKRNLRDFWMVLASILLAASAASAKAPGIKKNLTCDDFVKLDEVSRPKILYWTDGFNSYGQPIDETVDFDQNDRLVPILIRECTKTPKELLSDKIKEQKKKKTL